MSLTCSWVCGLVLKNIKGPVQCEYCLKWTWRKSSYECATCNKHISYFAFLEADLSRDMTLECAQCHFGKQTAFSIQDIVGFSKRNVTFENEPNSTVYKVENQILSKCCFYAESENSQQFKPVECKESVGNNEPNSKVHEEEKQVLSRGYFVAAENDNCHQFKPVKSKESVGSKELFHDKMTLDNQISNCEICGKQFSKKMELENHKRLHHNGQSKKAVNSSDSNNSNKEINKSNEEIPTQTTKPMPSATMVSSIEAVSPSLVLLETRPSTIRVSSTETSYIPLIAHHCGYPNSAVTISPVLDNLGPKNPPTLTNSTGTASTAVRVTVIPIRDHKRLHYNGVSQKAVDSSDSKNSNEEINKSNEKIPTQTAKPLPSTMMVSSIDAVSPVLDLLEARSSTTLVSSTDRASIPLIAQHSAVTISPVLDNLETKPSPTLTSSTDTASTASGVTVTPSQQIPNPDLTCKVCGKTFPSKSRFKAHKRVHTNERPFSCNKCKKAFKQKAHLQKHEKSCYKLETQKSMSNSGYNKSNDDSKISRTCTKCQKVYKTKKFLLNHILSDHKSGKIGQKCDFCEKTFSENYIMGLHIDVEHKERKPRV